MTISRKLMAAGESYAERDGRTLIHLNRLGCELDGAGGVDDPMRSLGAASLGGTSRGDGGRSAVAQPARADRTLLRRVAMALSRHPTQARSP